MLLFALSIFLSAFLLFQVQPMIGKFILPWFGGTSAVWSSLMLVFQVLLTGGYAYATWLVRRVRRPSMIHIGMLAVGMLFILLRGIVDRSPVFPSVTASTQTVQSPIIEIILLILTSIAFPFFIWQRTDL